MFKFLKVKYFSVIVLAVKLVVIEKVLMDFKAFQAGLHVRKLMEGFSVLFIAILPGFFPQNIDCLILRGVENSFNC